MTKPKIAVVAIGGNSLIKSESKTSAADQYQAAKESMLHIADMIEAGWEVAIGHGNGPQVGFILRQSEVTSKVEGVPEVPLDVCGAQSQGFIGYMLQQNLQNELYQRGIKKNVATDITQVLVDPDDPAFKNPTKPIGGFMTEAEAKKREAELGWSVVEDAGRGWRRVVASPLPKEVVEFDTISALLYAGVVVVTVGGGGIPVIDLGNGDYNGPQQSSIKITPQHARARSECRPVPHFHRGREGGAQLRQAQPAVARPPITVGCQTLPG